MGKDCLNHKRGHAIIGFNHGLSCYVKNMALGPQLRQKPRPTASVFVYLSPSGHVFNIAWQAMIKTHTTGTSDGSSLGTAISRVYVLPGAHWWTIEDNSK